MVFGGHDTAASWMFKNFTADRMHHPLLSLYEDIVVRFDLQFFIASNGLHGLDSFYL